MHTHMHMHMHTHMHMHMHMHMPAELPQATSVRPSRVVDTPSTLPEASMSATTCQGRCKGV